MNIIEALKAIPLTVKLEQHTHSVYGEIVEFPDEFEEEATQDAVIKELAKGLKGWAGILAAEYFSTIDEKQIPYILKALVSTEQELEECLRKSMNARL